MEKIRLELLCDFRDEKTLLKKVEPNRRWKRFIEKVRLREVFGQTSTAISLEIEQVSSNEPCDSSSGTKIDFSC